MILIDLLNGHREAVDAVESSGDPVISIVTWIEVLAGVRNEDEERRARGLMAGMDVQPLSPEVAEMAIRYRKALRLKLPDAVILATARHLGCSLLTRNTQDFAGLGPDITFPYTL
jgi:hypothetical protein